MLSKLFIPVSFELEVRHLLAIKNWFLFNIKGIKLAFPDVWTETKLFIRFMVLTFWADFTFEKNGQVI